MFSLIQEIGDTSISNLSAIFQRETGSLQRKLEEPKSEEKKSAPRMEMPFLIKEPPLWIYGRGFTPETARKWGWRTSNEGSLVIPVHNQDNQLTGWVCRRAGKQLPKYIYSLGMKTSEVLFGANYLPPNSKSIYITEGPLDAIWLNQNGYPAVALFGVHLSRIQERILLSFRAGEIILCLDNDAPGREASMKIMKRLEKYCVVKFINVEKPFKDVQDVREKVVLKNIIDRRSIIQGV